jgi:hypothetical protein
VLDGKIYELQLVDVELVVLERVFGRSHRCLPWLDVNVL